MKRLVLLALASLLALTATAASAGDCTGYVVGVQPISKYNHATGAAFLAARSGPGSGYPQVGEFYAGDEIAAWNRSGNWWQVMCMSGRCENPLWGPANPSGWVYGKYISVAGVCP